MSSHELMAEHMSLIGVCI